MTNRSSLIANLRGLPRGVWVLCLGTFLNKFGAFVLPFLTVYLGQRGFSLAQTSLTLAAYGTGHLLASLIGGYLTDRIGRRPTIVISMFSAAVVMILFSQAAALWSLITLSFLTGLSAELYRPACVALISDLVSEAQRPTAFAAYRWALNVGWAFGPATAGFLTHYSFFWLFLGDAITCFLFGLISLLALPTGLGSQGREVAWPVALKDIRANRPFLRMVCGTFGIGLVFVQMSSTFGLQVTHLGFSMATYGALISLNGALVMLFELPITSLIQHLPPRPVIAVGYVLLGIGYGLTALVSTLPGLVATVCLWTLGEMISMPVQSAYVAGLAPREYRGRYAGVMGFTWALGVLIGPTGGLMLFGYSPVWLWLACAFLGLLSSWVVGLNFSSRK